jgi:hypothetical protein
MKLFISLLLTFLSGCSWPVNVKLSDRVEVINGFYETCQGIAIGQMRWIMPCQTKSLVRFTDKCRDIDSSAVISNCDLKIIE